MAETGPPARLPDRQLADEDLQAYRHVYVELLGLVPPRILAPTETPTR